MSRLRIVNLNTWIGLLVRGLLGVEKVEPEGHKRRRLEALAAELRARDPDVVTLQECLPLPSFARELADMLGYDHIWRVANSGLRFFGVGVPWGVERGEGLAILARKELGLSHLATRRLSGRGFVTNWMSVQLGPVRYAIAGRVDVGGRPAIVVNTHIRYGFPNHRAFWDAWASLRTRGVVDREAPPGWLLRLLRDNRQTRDAELRRLAAWLNALAEEHRAPILLGADFNLDPGAPQITEFLEATGFTNVLPTYAPGALTWDPQGNYNVAYGNRLTWDDGRPKSMILQLMAYLDSVPQTPDHVMCSPDMTPTAGGVAFDTPHEGVLASDHYGVWADATLDR